MERTITFKVEYTIQLSEKEYQKLLLEDGVTLDKEKLLNEKNFKKAVFFGKSIVGKIKNFIMG